MKRLILVLLTGAATGSQQPCSPVTGVVPFSAFTMARAVFAEFPAW